MNMCHCQQCNGTLEPDYPEECPDTCASMVVVHEKCGGIGGCECFLHKHLGIKACAEVPAQNCDCPTAEDIASDKADAVEHARESREDR